MPLAAEAPGASLRQLPSLHSCMFTTKSNTTMPCHCGSARALNTDRTAAAACGLQGTTNQILDGCVILCTRPVHNIPHPSKIRLGVPIPQSCTSRQVHSAAVTDCQYTPRVPFFTPPSTIYLP